MDRVGGGDQPLAGLRRLMQPRPRPAPGEVCDFCGEAIPEEHSHLHSHVVDVTTRGLRCACRSCWLLFAPEGAAGGRYRAVPERVVHDPAFALTDPQWEALQIPVGVAFFFHNSALGRTVALYPSPAGATESLLPLDTWEEITGANPLLADMAPDVEALLVHRDGGRTRCYLAPIDVCYELVGIIRRTWRGFDGGTEAREAIGGFFGALHERSGAGAGRS